MMGGIELGGARRNSEILAITGKITQALHEFDNLYMTSQDDEMVNDITSQIECLESGPLKYQLGDFVMRFKEISAAADQSCVERNEVLESVMQWFTGQQFSQEFDEIGVEDDIDENSLRLRDELVTTKIGFQKLHKLNEEMVAMKDEGADVRHLERERNSIRQHAILNFNSFKRASLVVKNDQELRDRETKKEQMGEVWKNAAGEICGLLKRVRKDGVEYIEELEKMVRKLTTDIEENAHYFEKMKRQVKGYELLERKWQDDNMSLMDQKALTRKKMGRYKRELRKALEALSKYERVTVPKFMKDDDIEEAKEASPLKTAKEEEARKREQMEAAAPMSGGGIMDPAILRAQLRDCRNQIEQLKGEKEMMSQEVNQMKETMEDLEDDVLRLEKDKEELVHQMKQNSLRPDTRRLSVVQPGRRASRVLSSSLTIVKLKGADSSDRGGGSNVALKRCCKCGLKVTSPQPSETQGVGVESTKTDITDSGTDILEEVEKTDETEKPQTTPSVMVDVRLNHEEQVVVLKLRCEELQRQVEALQAQLSQTPIKEATVEKTAAEDVKTDSSTEPELIEGQSTEALQSPEETDVPLKDETPVPQGPDPLFKDIVARAKGPWEAIIVCHKSIQTDTQIEPLGPWPQSGGQALQGNAWKAPPPPPTPWLELESPQVTANRQTNSDVNSAAYAGQVEPLKEAMLSGVEPQEVKQEAIDCANLVHRQLDRMTEGIRGFMNYTNTLVDRETRIIASANRELKSRLSQHEIHRINQEMQQMSSSSLVSDLDLGFAHTDVLMSSNENQTRENTGGVKASVFLESQLPVEQRVKNQLGRIGQRSTDILKHAYDLVLGTLHEQHREYEHIYHTLQDRQTKSEGLGSSLKRMELEDLERQRDAELTPKRSQSHGDINKFQGEADRKSVGLTRSQSNMEQGTHKVTFEDSDSPSRTQVTSAMSKMIPVKEEVAVSKATISKKGQIILSTTPVENNSSFTMGIGKPKDPLHRKVKPTPLSHSKLKLKQDEIFHRGDLQRSEFKTTRLVHRHTRQKSGAGRHQNNPDRKSPVSPSAGRRVGTKGPQAGKIVLTDFELPSDFFSEYTVGELEKTAMHYADQQKQNFHSEMLEKVHFPTLNKDVTSQRNQITLGNQLDDRFPKL